MSEHGGAMRLPAQPGEVINRAEPLEFTWNGRAFRGYAGDTIVSALAAAGERVFSRSLKYHRPRGLLTASYHDPGCMIQVGDEPNVRPFQVNSSGSARLITSPGCAGSRIAWPCPLMPAAPRPGSPRRPRPTGPRSSRCAAPP